MKMTNASGAAMRTEARVRTAIETRLGKVFSAREIGAETNLCRQTIYKIINRLNAGGLVIRGEAGFGFVARKVRT